MLHKEPLFPVKDNFKPYRNVESELLYGDINKVKEPKISVIVPIFNHPEYLRETLLSIINQDFKDEYEIVVVDNNMTLPYSPNYEIVKELDNNKVFYYRHSENIGFEGNCNRGVELSRSKYISFCHDDDLLLPDALSTLMSIQKFTGDKGIIANFYIIDEKSNEIYVPYYTPDKYKLFIEESVFWLLERCARLQIGSLWNREKFILCGGYSPGQAPCQDYGLHATYGSQFGSIMCLKPTFKYRKANNASKDLCKLFPEREIYIMDDLAKLIKWIPSIYLKIVKTIAIKKVINGNIYTWGIDQDLQSFTFVEKLVDRINGHLYRRKIHK